MKLQKKNKQSNDLVLILLWPIIATVISFLLRPKAIASVFLFLIIPSLYLAIRGKQYIGKSIIFAIIVSIPSMIVIDYIAYINKDWLVPNTVFPFKILGIIPFEDILWALFTCFFVVMFYEYFLNRHKTNKVWQSKMKYLLIVILTIFIVFIILFFASPSFLEIQYFYLTWGTLLLLIPFFLQLFKYPKTTLKFFLVACYFFYLHFIYEVSALKLGWWKFPDGHFIGWISTFGISFPLEELLFWFILFALAVLSYYEFFDDDEK